MQNLFTKQQRNNNRGFTIIEVVLVLAIAGLIFLIVFTALPQLQQSRRDTARKSDLGLIVAKTVDFSSNNGTGIPPASAADFEADVEPDYIDGELQDPSGNAYVFINTGVAADLSDPGDYTYVRDEDCAGNAAVGRFSVFMQLEDGQACQDDQ